MPIYVHVCPGNKVLTDRIISVIHFLILPKKKKRNWIAKRTTKALYIDLITNETLSEGLSGKKLCFVRVRIFFLN